MTVLSIIVPVYNVEKFLENCIQSILSQEYGDFELILIDDGSTDSSGVLCEKYAKQDKRVITCHTKNKGVGAARNLGIRLATGKYITFVDSDDKISKDAFSSNIKILDEDISIDFLQYPCIRKFGSDTPILPPPLYTAVIENVIEMYSLWLVDKLIRNYVCDKIFRRRVFDKIHFREDIHYEDRYLMSELLCHCKKIYISSLGCYYYYEREGQITQQPYTAYKLRSLIIADLNIVRHIKEYSLLSGVCLERYSNCIFYYGMLLRNCWGLGSDEIQELKRLTPPLDTIFCSHTLIGIKMKCLLVKLFGLRVVKILK